jgi:hypothetical protein
MLRGEIFIVTNDPLAGREGEYHDWYNNIHLPDLVRLPGVAAAQRFRVIPGVEVGGPMAGHLALYELNDTAKTMAGLKNRRGTALLRPTESTDRTHQTGDIFTVRQSGGRSQAARVSRGALILFTSNAGDRADAVFKAAAEAAESALMDLGPLQQMPDPHPAFGVLLAFADDKAARKVWKTVTGLAGSGDRAAALQQIGPRLVAS